MRGGAWGRGLFANIRQTFKHNTTVKLSAGHKVFPAQWWTRWFSFDNDIKLDTFGGQLILLDVKVVCEGGFEVSLLSTCPYSTRVLTQHVSLLNTCPYSARVFTQHVSLLSTCLNSIHQLNCLSPSSRYNWQSYMTICYGTRMAATNFSPM